MKKTISIVVPCYNEEENVVPLANALRLCFKEQLPEHQYEILFIDNDSSDKTREKIRGLCKLDKGIKAIFNAKNFGQFNSPYYAMLQSTGDATILMAADFQDPVEMIPRFVHAWEEGYRIVIGVKTESNESKIMYALRSLYYKLIRKMSSVDQISQFTGFGLYDQGFISVMKSLDDPTPFLRGIVAELGYRRKDIPYTQPKRRAGVTHNNFYTLYDAAMLSFTSYTKVGLRIAVFFGGICAGLSMLFGLLYLIMKLIWWDRFPAGMAPMLIGMLFLGSVQIFFIGLLGEYILSINQRVMKRPLVVEEERLNFSEQPGQDTGENSALEQPEQAISEDSSSKQSGQDVCESNSLEQPAQAISEDSSSKQSGQDVCESSSLEQPVHQGSSSIEE